MILNNKKSNLKKYRRKNNKIDKVEYLYLNIFKYELINYFFVNLFIIVQILFKKFY